MLLTYVNHVHHVLRANVREAAIWTGVGFNEDATAARSVISAVRVSSFGTEKADRFNAKRGVPKASL